MERKRQREMALAAIAVVIAAVAVYRVMSSGSEVSTRSHPIDAPAPRPQPPKGQITSVDLDALNAPRPEVVDARRNPFRFKPPPPPPPAPVRPVASQPTDPAAPPPPPRIALKFIGVLESLKTGRVAVLSDNRGIYQGREGETIEGRYRIVRIGVESIDLAYLDGRGRQTIRLTGQ